MAFCTSCGNRIGDTDRFCAACGSAQTATAAKGLFDGISPRKASLLCYIPVVGWIPALVVLASARFQTDRTVRFHAFQGLYLFVAWLIADWVIKPMSRSMDFHIEGLLKAAIMVAWVFMIVKTSQNEVYRLPFLGELAERSANEQR